MNMKSIFLAGLLVIASGCSSTPTGPIQADSRNDYIKQVETRLDKYEDNALKTETGLRQDMIAAVRDTRVELRALEAAPADRWTEFRPKVDSRLERLRTIDSNRAE